MITRGVKFIGTESRTMVARGWGNEEPLFNGYRLLVFLQDEKSSEFGKGLIEKTKLKKGHKSLVSYNRVKEVECCKWASG